MLCVVDLILARGGERSCERGDGSKMVDVMNP